MNITLLISVALIGAVLSVIVKQYRPEYSMLISLAVGAIVLINVILCVNPLINEITRLSEAAGLDNVYITVLLKSLAICYLTQMASDCCKDCGEAAIAMKLETAGKIAILLISLPMFRELTELITGLIEV